ncbi:unnamed protein product, partial [Phaeothamnion confervicola]
LLRHGSYFALRHGQSVANMEGIISSDPAIGTVRHGLTANGRAQARAAATRLLDLCGRDDVDGLIFVTSDFTRAVETAEECRAALARIVDFERAAVDDAASFPAPPLAVRAELRERFFGELDATVLVNYNKVWPKDLEDAAQGGYGVESVSSVAARLRKLILSLEEGHQNASLVLTSHADTLQILQCYVAEADVRLFSQYRFANGEIRQLFQDPFSLPAPKPLSYK